MNATTPPVYGRTSVNRMFMIFFALMIVVISCSSPTEHKEKETNELEPNPQTEVILHAKRFDADVYFRYTTTGEYEVVIPEFYFRVVGRYTVDEYGNMVLDGSGCDGTYGVYYIRPVAGGYYSTSADYCPRHFWITGFFERTQNIPQLTQKTEVNYEHVLERNRRAN